LQEYTINLDMLEQMCLELEEDVLLYDPVLDVLWINSVLKKRLLSRSGMDSGFYSNADSGGVNPVAGSDAGFGVDPIADSAASSNLSDSKEMLLLAMAREYCKEYFNEDLSDSGLLYRVFSSGRILRTVSGLDSKSGRRYSKTYLPIKQGQNVSYVLEIIDTLDHAAYSHSEQSNQADKIQVDKSSVLLNNAQALCNDTLVDASCKNTLVDIVSSDLQNASLSASDTASDAANHNMNVSVTSVPPVSASPLLTSPVSVSPFSLSSASPPFALASPVSILSEDISLDKHSISQLKSLLKYFLDSKGIPCFLVDSANSLLVSSSHFDSTSSYISSHEKSSHDTSYKSISLIKSIILTYLERIKSSAENKDIAVKVLPEAVPGNLELLEGLKIAGYTLEITKMIFNDSKIGYIYLFNKTALPSSTTRSSRHISRDISKNMSRNNSKSIKSHPINSKSINSSFESTHKSKQLSNNPDFKNKPVKGDHTYGRSSRNNHNIHNNHTIHNTYNNKPRRSLHKKSSKNYN